jgi:DNA-binding MarR family transcriptional regulator
MGDTNRLLSQVIDPSRAEVLRLVVTRGPIRPIEIAERLDMSPSSVIRQVCALEEDESVAVARDSDGRGSWLVLPTDTGRTELRQLDQAGVDILALVVDEWNREDVASLATLLTRLGTDWSRFRQASARKVERC